MLAIYRRGKYDSSANIISDIPEDLEDGWEEELELPEPVVEEQDLDDDIELLDALDEI